MPVTTVNASTTAIAGDDNVEHTATTLPSSEAVTLPIAAEPAKVASSTLAASAAVDIVLITASPSAELTRAVAAEAIGAHVVADFEAVPPVQDVSEVSLVATSELPPDVNDQVAHITSDVQVAGDEANILEGARPAMETSAAATAAEVAALSDAVNFTVDVPAAAETMPMVAAEPVVATADVAEVGIIKSASVPAIDATAVDAGVVLVEEAESAVEAETNFVFAIVVEEAVAAAVESHTEAAAQEAFGTLRVDAQLDAEETTTSAVVAAESGSEAQATHPTAPASPSAARPAPAVLVLLSADKWVPDNATRACQACSTAFVPLLNRKHHCRL